MSRTRLPLVYPPPFSPHTRQRPKGHVVVVLSILLNSRYCLSLLSATLVLPGRLKSPPIVLSTLSKRNTKLEEFEDDSREVLEEGIIILGVTLNMLLEGLVLDEGHVGRKHHERLRSLVLILIIPTLAIRFFPFSALKIVTYLSGTVPLLPLPLLLAEKTVVVIGQNCG